MNKKSSTRKTSTLGETNSQKEKAEKYNSKYYWKVSAVSIYCFCTVWDYTVDNAHLCDSPGKATTSRNLCFKVFSL